jgi:hypothetical protein
MRRRSCDGTVGSAPLGIRSSTRDHVAAHKEASIMSTTSALKAPTLMLRRLADRRIAAAVLLIIAVAVVAFAVGRVTAGTHSSTSYAPAQTSTSVTSTQECRPGVPC